MLLDRGYRVTILAKDWAWTKDYERSRITSQIAGALREFPPGGCGLTEIESVGSGWATLEHLRDWSLQSYEFYTKYATLTNEHEKDGAAIGLKVPDLYQLFYHDVEEEDERGKEDYAKLQAIKETNRIKGLVVYKHSNEP